MYISPTKTQQNALFIELKQKKITKIQQNKLFIELKQKNEHVIYKI